MKLYKMNHRETRRCEYEKKKLWGLENTANRSYTGRSKGFHEEKILYGLLKIF